MPKVLLTIIITLLVFTFPTLSPAGEAAVEGEEKPVTCLWGFLLPEPDFQPEAGDAYRITISGDDRTRLFCSYARLRPCEGEARIAVHTQKTSDNRVLIDQANVGLFTAETGEFTLSLFVPAGWPLYLVEATDNPYSDPVVLSNIVELP